MEAFKRAINNFLQSLLSERDEVTQQFNYVCRESLEFLDLNKKSDSMFEDQFTIIKKDNDEIVYEEM